MKRAKTRKTEKFKTGRDTYATPALFTYMPKRHKKSGGTVPLTRMDLNHSSYIESKIMWIVFSNGNFKEIDVKSNIHVFCQYVE